MEYINSGAAVALNGVEEVVSFVKYQSVFYFDKF